VVTAEGAPRRQGRGDEDLDRAWGLLAGDEAESLFPGLLPDRRQHRVDDGGPRVVVVVDRAGGDAERRGEATNARFAALVELPQRLGGDLLRSEVGIAPAGKPGHALTVRRSVRRKPHSSASGGAE
jgi:hypothetical protein